MTPRGPRIQATIDAVANSPETMTWLVHMWDDRGHDETWFIEAKDDKTAWQRAHDRFLEVHYPLPEIGVAP